MPTTDVLTTILELVQRSLDQTGCRSHDVADQAHLSRFHFDRVRGQSAGVAMGQISSSP